MKHNFNHIKNLPPSTKRLLGFGFLVAFTVALPLFIWAVVTQNFNPSEKAQTIDTPTPADNTYDNPNSCNGTCGSNSNCQANYYCYIKDGATSGYCRNPLSPNDTSCSSNTPTPTAKPATPKPSQTPEVVYYAGQTTPKPASQSAVKESFVNTPTPAAILAPKASNGLDLKYIAIIAFSVIALGFGISVLVSSFKTPPPPTYPQNPI